MTISMVILGHTCCLETFIRPQTTNRKIFKKVKDSCNFHTKFSWRKAAFTPRISGETCYLL